MTKWIYSFVRSVFVASSAFISDIRYESDIYIFFPFSSLFKLNALYIHFKCACETKCGKSFQIGQLCFYSSEPIWMVFELAGKILNFFIIIFDSIQNFSFERKNICKLNGKLFKNREQLKRYKHTEKNGLLKLYESTKIKYFVMIRMISQTSIDPLK